MEFKPEDDGFDHINVYSKSKSKLGRSLSNFAHTPITLGDETFESVESWWYWMKMNNINKSSLFPVFTPEQIAEVKIKIGKEAKLYFRGLFKEDSTPFNPEKSELKEAYLQKLVEHPEIEKALFANKLPIAHYYMMFKKKVNADSTAWTANLWQEIKNELS
jgi:predicted NAD-dependent protein-ADP-ribosyltransferase YbiA (DUF1768 family)